MLARLLAIWLLTAPSALMAERINYCVETINQDCILENVYQALGELKHTSSIEHLVAETSALAASTKRQLPFSIIADLSPKQLESVEMFRQAELAAFLGANGSIENHSLLAEKVRRHSPAYNYYLLSAIKYLEEANARTLSIYQMIRSGAPDNIRAESAIYIALLLNTEQTDIAALLFDDLENRDVDINNRVVYLADLVATLATKGNHEIAETLYKRLKYGYKDALVWPHVDVFIMAALDMPNDLKEHSPGTHNPYIYAYTKFFSASKDLYNADPASASQHISLLIAAIESIDDPSQRVYFYHRTLKNFF